MWLEGWVPEPHFLVPRATGWLKSCPCGGMKDGQESSLYGKRPSDALLASFCSLGPRASRTHKAPWVFTEHLLGTGTVPGTGDPVQRRSLLSGHSEMGKVL